MMDSEEKIIVVAGASGYLGKLMCDALLSRAQLEGRSLLIRGLVRRRAGQAPVTSPKGAPTVTTGQRLVIEPVDYDSDTPLPQTVSDWIPHQSSVMRRTIHGRSPACLSRRRAAGGG